MLEKYCLILVVIIMLNACCGAALFVGGTTAGVGGALYISGALEKEFDVSSSKLWEAALSGAKKLKLKVESKTEKSKKNVLIAYDENNRRIKIEVRPLTNDRSKLIIRVGTFGDEALSRKILDVVESRL